MVWLWAPGDEAHALDVDDWGYEIEAQDGDDINFTRWWGSYKVYYTGKTLVVPIMGNLTVKPSVGVSVAVIEIPSSECGMLWLLQGPAARAFSTVKFEKEPGPCRNKMCWIPISIPGDDMKYTIKTYGKNLTIQKQDGSVSFCTDECEVKGLQGLISDPDAWWGANISFAFHKRRDYSKWDRPIGHYLYNQVYEASTCSDDRTDVTPEKPWFPWWGIFVLIIAALLLIASIAGPILCCCCNRCSCCGCYCCCGPAKPENLLVEA